MSAEKKIDEMKMANRYMFASLMREPEICKGVLEILFSKKIKSISYVEELESLEECLKYGGVGAEVLYEDETLEDVEIMIMDECEYQKREVHSKLEMEYYLNCLNSGHVPEKRLKLIYLCTYDAFACNKWRYTITNSLKELDGSSIDTYQDTVYINLTCTDFSDSDENVEELLKYLQNKNVEDNFFKDIDMRIAELKKSEQWREIVSNYL